MLDDDMRRFPLFMTTLMNTIPCKGTALHTHINRVGIRRTAEWLLKTNAPIGYLEQETCRLKAGGFDLEGEQPARMLRLHIEFGHRAQ